MSNWTIFSNHGHVLLYLARDPVARLRDVAADVGITERAVQKIVRDLQDGGMVTVRKRGRRNQYRIHRKKSLRHDLEAHCSLGELADLIVRQADRDKSRPAKQAKTAPPGPGFIERQIPAKKTPVVAPKTPDTAPRVKRAEQKTSDVKTVTKGPSERQQGTLF